MRLLVALSAAVLFLTTSPLSAQHLGSRLQWQPETMQGDARLEQPVQIEIIGRAAVPALELLSQATGVSLGVAPEDLDTVGERKLTIISKGLTLKAIMVQLPEALQEAHRDVDGSGDEPVYLLHRNAGVEAAVEQEQENQRQRNLANRAADRSTRVEAAKAALAMSPDQLADLEKTDLFLARAARYAPTRALMEAYASLPEEQMDTLTNTGLLSVRYDKASPALRQAVRIACQLQHRYLAWTRQVVGSPYSDEADAWESELDQLESRLQSDGGVLIRIHGRSRDDGFGPQLTVESDDVSFGTMLLPARRSRVTAPGNPYQWLLVETGETAEAARNVVEKSRADWLKLRDAREWDESDWVEPTDPRLHDMLALPATSDNAVILSHAQQVISDHTGISVISDYFTAEWVGPSPNQPALGGPLWRDLYVLGKLGQFSWNHVGDCLVFHRTNWYQLSGGELRESLIADYLARIERQGHLTLDDVAELAFALATRRGAGRLGRFSLPANLHDAGASQAAYPYSRWPLLLWRALSPGERAAAESEQGLRFGDLPRKRVAALARAAWPVARPFGDGQTPDDRIRGGVFTVRRSQGIDERGAYTRHGLSIEYLDGEREPMTVTVVLHEAKPES